MSLITCIEHFTQHLKNTDFFLVPMEISLQIDICWTIKNMEIISSRICALTCWN